MAQWKRLRLSLSVTQSLSELNRVIVPGKFLLGTNPLRLSLLLLPLVLGGCARSGIAPETLNPELPDQWQSEAVSAPVPVGWLEAHGDEGLLNLVKEALANNFDLARQAASVRSAEQQVVIDGAPLFPAFNLGFDGTRQRNVLENSKSHSSNLSVALDLNWEVDLWGKLSAAKRRSVLTLEARRASLYAAQLQLAADVSRAWYDVLEARQLRLLFEERLANLERSLEIIEFGYRQGITEALDVYLGRNEVEQERTRLAQQRQLQLEAVNRLQFLLGRYPNGELETEALLPVNETAVAAGLPLALLKRRPDIQSAWFDLLSADARLAVAHKDRFPSLTISGSVGDSDNSVNRLLDEGALAWSLLGGLAQPVFQGGRLAAREKQALAELQRLEQQYLDQVFTALTEVENTLSAELTLAQRYQSVLKAEENALAARALAFDQYQRGIISFTSVLEAQRRAFDAQTSVIELRNRRLQNRIALYLALGGEM